MSFSNSPGTKIRSPKSKGNFTLFKPLFGIALAAISFELLPIDFQHALAPSLVSYEEVFYAGFTPEEYACLQRNEITNEIEYVPQDYRTMKISLN
ncbi:MAG: hypothetical protein HUJ26_10575 [Planctomycetaceae bacterium]|nr:hypothetical protein [Planctomycetaceae bacterium]